MTTPATEVLLEGRIVCGHPMTRRPVKIRDRVTKVETPLFEADGVTPVTDVYLGLAIPKNGAIDWKVTPWGQQIIARGMQDWPNGEHGAPTFAWKVTDGDSQVPNTKNKKPCDREGWPGNWVIHCSTRFHVSCHHPGKYSPLQQIENENEIKTGDYARLLVGVKGNNPSESPGIYVNPTKLELSRPGEPIVSEGGMSAEEAFGGGSPALAPSPESIAPAPDFLDGPAPEPLYVFQGKNWTREQLKASKWPDAKIDALPTA